ncbi:PREDICTED: uncharacterized protein LOC109164745 [Ipomoea nil]|uniref:uncharacterized protein LOC109164745 n=1 Tax=Ipomoea nil TaxID=35883 RepID=UPI0009011D49|nr:PREDICTED: uncharacterized protein LOC109164745 [Ipomoea nil]
MEILTDHTKKQKTVAFVAEEHDDTANPDESDISEEFTKQKISKGASSNMSKTDTKTSMSNSKSAASRPARSREKSNNKGIKCYECEGFGHVQVECPTYLRRKKSMTATTWSDDEPESEAAGSGAEEMFVSSEVRVLQNAVNVFKGQVADRDALIKEYTDREDNLKQEVKELKLELSTYKKKIQMTDTTSTLDEILGSGRQSCARFGIGFTGGTNKDKTTFVKTSDPRPEDTPESSTAKQYRESAPATSSAWRTRGYEDTSDLSVITSTKNKGPKNIAISRDEKWYFDSGCSRHMTGNAKFLSDINTSNGEVTFGDGVKGQVTGVGTLNVAGLPKLKKVLLVNGLHANLISISQLCDQNWNVSFTNDNCSVMDNEKQCVIEGSCGKRFRKKQKGTIIELFPLFHHQAKVICGYYWISDYLFG